CKPRKALLAPSGYSIGSSKEFAGFTYTAEVCPAVAGRTKGLYHLNGAVARAARGRRGVGGRRAGGVYNEAKRRAFPARGSGVTSPKGDERDGREETRPCG